MATHCQGFILRSNVSNVAKRKINPVHSGAVLAKDFLKGLEISRYRLAKGTSVAARRINEIVQGIHHIDEPLSKHAGHGTAKRGPCGEVN